ncbi:hypothetical protein ACFE04_007238 [Oxalis oulophora]
MSSSNNVNHESSEIKYKGVRRRRWGKWVSEIRVPGTQERLWLGSYASPEAAAVAHDVAFYCLKRPSSSEGLNFPGLIPASVVNANMSPKSVQQAASDAGMAVDAQIIVKREEFYEQDKNKSGGINQGMCMENIGVHNCEHWGTSNGSREEEGLSISVEDYL